MSSNDSWRRILPKYPTPESIFAARQLDLHRLADMLENPKGWDDDEGYWRESEAEIAAISKASPGVLYRFDYAGEPHDPFVPELQRVWALNGEVITQAPEIVWPPPLAVLESNPPILFAPPEIP